MPEALIDYYKAIEDSSAKMLQAARDRDWDGVVRYEGACAVLIEQLRFKSQKESLPPEQRREKARIMATHPVERRHDPHPGRASPTAHREAETAKAHRG